jgi:hypothetical protein
MARILAEKSESSLSPSHSFSRCTFWGGTAGFSAYWLIRGRILVLKGLRFLRARATALRWLYDPETPRAAQPSDDSTADLECPAIRWFHPRFHPRNPLSHSLSPAYYPGMTKASVNETLFLFLFRCEKCHKPITAWSRTPKPGTLEEAEKHVLPLHCVKECGWSSAKMGSEAIASWAVPWRYETEK